MPASPWTIHDDRAVLELPGLQGEVHLLVPALGLHRIRCHGCEYPQAQLLGVVGDSIANPTRGDVIEWHVRGCELVAAYRPAADTAMRVDAVWKAMMTEADVPAPALELMISVHTQLLEAWPELSAVSRWPGELVLQLAECESEGFNAVRLAPAQPTALGPDAGAPCWLVREPTRWGCAQMMCPADDQGSTLTYWPAPEAAVRLTHRLFARQLEKGVLLRGRIRSLLMRATEEDATVAGLFRAFTAEPPMLSTR
ncbi:MAG: hypothetical protein ACOY3P_02250 [Planctomycetota bacterium]